MFEHLEGDHMNRFTIALALAVALAFAAPLTSLHAAPQTSAPTQVPVVGTVTGGGSLVGTFNLTKFVNDAGQLVAVGTIAGTLTNAAGQTTTFLQTVALPVSNVTGTCAILHLDVGPIALDLLGLQVNLSRIVLDIVAESGAGKLLGNLLCDVANLLNDPSGLARILNQILAQL
jgi:hypothetical protein